MRSSQTFEQSIAEHSLDYAAGKLGDAEQLCLRQGPAGLERGSDSFRLFGRESTSQAHPALSRTSFQAMMRCVFGFFRPQH